MFSGVVVWMEIMDNGRGLFVKNTCVHADQALVILPVWCLVCRQQCGPRRWGSSGSTAAWSRRLWAGSATGGCRCRSRTPEGRPFLEREQIKHLLYFHRTEALAVSVRLYSQASKTLIISFHSFLQSHVSTVTSSYVTSSGLFVPWQLMMLNGAFCDVTCHKNLSDANPTNLADVGPWRLFINALLTHLLFL